MSLQSGSNGNCYYVEGGGARLLIDAGISGRRARQRLAAAGIDAADVQAVLVSHDHGDHVRNAGIFHRAFAADVHATAGTMALARRQRSLGRMAPPVLFQPGQDLTFGDLRVQTIPTPHDGAEPVSFVFDDGRRRLGILTDLGRCFDGLAEIVASLDAVILESNYDEAMLEAGPYPAFLKSRIRGPNGHISNAEAAHLIKQASGRLRWACLGHLSEQNNTPATALAAVRRAVGKRLPLHVAGRTAATDILEV